MHKKIYALLALMIGFTFLQCSNDDDNDISVNPEPAVSTLFVNGAPFAFGGNAAGDIHNSHSSNTFGGQTVETFLLLNASNQESFSVATGYVTAPANNTFPFSLVGATIPDVFAVGSYTLLDSQTLFTSQLSTSGTVKITHVGGTTYKLEFDSLTLYQDGNPDATKTITGYCLLEF